LTTTTIFKKNSLLLNSLSLGSIQDDLIEKIKKWIPNYKGITHALQKSTILEAITAPFFFQPKLAA
jgi:hypothetical protein